MRYRKIGFYAGAMNLRGTHIAMFDYALQNQALLGNQSVVFYDELAPNHEPAVMDKFKKHFELLPFRQFHDLGRISEKNGVDAIYIIKSGEIDEQVVADVPNLIHAVFPQHVSQRHGEVYAFVSGWLSKECSNNKIPFVPHMISLPDVNEDMRADLDIPSSATVFGCYGGSDSFNIKFVHQSISETLAKRSDAHFIFLNISPFMQHERIRFLPGNADMNYKVKFINSCDAMIHARGIGESFGLACGEFSIRNKPVITYALSPQRSHLDILGDKAVTYKGPRELERILTGFDRNWSASRHWDCYSAEFSPAPVMEKFKEVFLADHAGIAAPRVTITDRCAIQYFRARKRLRSLSRKLYL